MARYTGPRVKVCRALGTVLPGLTTIATLERPYPPGQHGMRRRRKDSDYKTRLQEKQKLRFHYGVLEKQFQRYVAQSASRKGPTGVNLVAALETRLDNIVWRLGLAATIPAARQLVVHGHVEVDGHRVDRPSYRVSTGQVIGVREKSRTKQFVQDNLEASTTRVLPAFLEFDPAKAEGKMVAVPAPADVPFAVNTQAVIEFYSQKL